MQQNYPEILARQWRAPAQALRIEALDYHTGGEPTRLLLRGFPTPEGATILQRRQRCMQDHDHLRQALMFEPRGHADMYGCLIVPPQRADSHFGVLFMHNQGYSTMCGHATLALIRYAYDSQLWQIDDGLAELKIDAPCGQIHAYAELQNGQLSRSYFDNVPSYVLADGCSLLLHGQTPLTYALVYGGAYYAFVDADQLDLTLSPEHYQSLIQLGQAIKLQIQAQTRITHPDPAEADLGFLYGTIFYSRRSRVHSKNVCVFADAELDRSPTGSGVSAYAALLWQRGELALKQSITIESLIGSEFSVSLQQQLDFFGQQALIPRVEGRAHLSARQEFFIEPDDPFPQGFLLR